MRTQLDRNIIPVENENMNTHSATILPVNLDDPAIQRADADSVLECLASNKPLDPAILERVRARSRQITETIRRERGLVDDDAFQALLDDET